MRKMSKVRIFLCIVFIASVVNANSLEDELKEDIKRRVDEIIDPELLPFRQSVTDVHQSAITIIAKIATAAPQLSKKIHDDIKTDVEKIEKDVEEIIEKIDDVKSAECSKFLTHLEETAFSLFLNSSLCIVDKLQISNEHLVKLTNFADDIINRVYKIKSDAYHCGDNVTDAKSAEEALLCISNAGENAKLIIATAPSAFDSYLKNLKYLLDTLEPTFTSCTAINDFVDFKDESSKVVNNTKKCINDKLN